MMLNERFLDGKLVEFWLEDEDFDPLQIDRESIVARLEVLSNDQSLSLEERKKAIDLKALAEMRTVGSGEKLAGAVKEILFESPDGSIWAWKMGNRGIPEISVRWQRTR